MRRFRCICSFGWATTLDNFLGGLALRLGNYTHEMRQRKTNPTIRLEIFQAAPTDVTSAPSHSSIGAGSQDWVSTNNLTFGFALQSLCSGAPSLQIALTREPRTAWMTGTTPGVASMELHTYLAERIATDPLEETGRGFVVAICGWADTGKSTLARSLGEALRNRCVTADWISTDSFMKDRSERNALGITGYHPMSISAADLGLALERFAAAAPFSYHPYDNSTGTKSEIPETVSPCRVLVVEGIHAFHPVVVKASALNVFIDAEESILREMRRRANLTKRGFSHAEAALRIQAEWDEFSATVLPHKHLADVLVQVTLDYRYNVLAP